MACKGGLPPPPPKKNKIGKPPSPKIFYPPPPLVKLFTPSAFFTHGYFVIEKDIFLELNRCIFQRSLTVC